MHRPHYACLFERFPSFTQTFVAREVMELQRQGARLPLYSIRSVSEEAVQHFPAELIRSVTVLPAFEELRDTVNRMKNTGQLHPSAVLTLRDWGSRPDKARVYEALWAGARLRDAGVRHVHTHFAGIGARTCWWMRQFYGFSYSFTGHANDLFCPDPDSAVSLRQLTADASTVITVSDFTAAWLRQNCPEAAPRIHRVYNGTGIESTARAAAEQKKNEPPLIFSAGRLIEKKGFAHLITACGILHRAGIAHRCVIAGEGPLHAALSQVIAQEGLGGVVTLVGAEPQQSINQWLGRASIFALPCVVEKDGGMDVLPTVIMEAMAAGLPCVSTRVAGVPEMIINNQTGFLTDPGDAASFASALTSLLHSPESAARMGAAGRALAERLFDQRKTAAQLRRILQATSKVNMSTGAYLRSPAALLQRGARLLSPVVRAPRLKRRRPVFPL